MGFWVHCSFSIATSLLLVFALLFVCKANAASSDCDLFMGSWVLSKSYPLYEAATCPFIEREFSCQKNGLVDLMYTQYRWQPLDCDLQRMAIKETFYISHGSPTLSIDDSIPMRHYLKSWKDKVFAQKPSSILVVSGHWETSVPTVNVVDRNETIYDFYGFPKEMYKLKYPAPGAPELAKRVKELLMASGVKHVNEDRKRGLDHGAWVPLMLMYPEANIPVCELSLQLDRDGTYHYNIGKALAPLKDEGVLIIGSGSAVHNLRNLQFGSNTVASWASEFDTWLKDALLEGRYEDVNHYEEKAPNAKRAHPSPDHFYPLHVAMGAAGENAKAKLIHQSWDLGTLSYASYSFTSATE